jgi:hypothetical protein
MAILPTSVWFLFNPRLLLFEVGPTVGTLYRGPTLFKRDRDRRRDRETETLGERAGFLRRKETDGDEGAKVRSRRRWAL